jgi:hypothetical protein
MQPAIISTGRHHNTEIIGNMTTQTSGFNASELCSRKLWQLVSADDRRAISAAELREAVAELASRRHYLAELQQMGKLGGCAPEA